jgi:hypothetical protein
VRPEIAHPKYLFKVALRRSKVFGSRWRVGLNSLLVRKDLVFPSYAGRCGATFWRHNAIVEGWLSKLVSWDIRDYDDRYHRYRTWLDGLCLARALLRGGYNTAVWNRTIAKADPLIDAGAVRSDSVGEALRAAPVAIICVDNYRSTRELLGTSDAAVSIEGRTVIQLSTGTPKEARESESWIQSLGGNYVDGAIMAYPADIGRPDTLILAAGDENAYRVGERYLLCLGGDTRYVGDQAGAAAALDLAMLSYTIGSIVGLIQGALICQSETVPLEMFGNMLALE